MTRERGEQAVSEDEREALAQDQLRMHGYTGTFTACTCELCDIARGLLELSADRARLLAENAALRETVAIRQRMIDIPTAWELTLATPEDQHHERCSYRTAKMLCDCAAFRVMDHVSGLLKTANQRADAAEARVQALERAMADLMHRLSTDEVRRLNAAPSQGAGE